ncbi:uncharacterized protein LOC120090229 isoform X3 [Benincasa hispida]|uniref:uncharacterized protein LOC120090229 isoform X3 n=1 Tax=Benincasa hispida TaxID=102211 RepID=UPI0018FF31DF|nr:uncharacterized protein LOC120090229 isoform X3 [Benincasa hispida]
MAFLEGLGHFFQNAMPYIAVISLQFGYAGMNIISAISLDRGMSHYVLVVYRHAFATAVMAPFALVLERKVRPKITFKIFIQMLVLALLGPLLDQNLYYMGLQMTSPTISCAIGNMLPSMTFAMAVLCKYFGHCPLISNKIIKTVKNMNKFTDGEVGVEKSQKSGEVVWNTGDARGSYVDDILQRKCHQLLRDKARPPTEHTVHGVAQPPQWRRVHQRLHFAHHLHRGLGGLFHSPSHNLEKIHSPSFSHHHGLLFGNPSSHCCHPRHGTPPLRMDHRLGHEPSSRRICRDCDLGGGILCSRFGYEDKRASFCYSFWPYGNSYCCLHGPFHLG